MPALPSVQVLASMARTTALRKKTLPLLWYQATLNRKPPYSMARAPRRVGAIDRARSEATKRTVAAAKAVNNQDPVAPFEYVTVTRNRASIASYQMHWPASG